VFEVISFDLDDTLWDAGPVLWRAEELHYAWLGEHLPRIAGAHSLLALQSLRRDLARAQPALAHDFTRLRIAALEALCAEHDYPAEVATTAVEVFLDARSQVALFDEVDAVLRALGQRYRLVALTNGNTDLVRAGVHHYFEFALSPADTGTSKPDPRMFEAVLARAGVTANAVLHVGDEPRYDILGAHNANIRSVWINRNARDWPAEFPRAHAEITTLDGLPDAIEQLAAAAAAERTLPA